MAELAVSQVGVAQVEVEMTAVKAVVDEAVEERDGQLVVARFVSCIGVDKDPAGIVYAFRCHELELDLSLRGRTQQQTEDEKG